MSRLLRLAVALAFVLGAFATPAVAAPTSYDIFCSPGPMSKVADVRGMSAFAFGTAAPATSGGAAQFSKCGWFTRAWRSGEPKQLCFSPAMMTALAQQGVRPAAAIDIPRTSTFQVYNDFQGCMIVTGFTLDASAAFAPQTLRCRNAFVLADRVEFSDDFYSYPMKAESCSPSSGIPPSGLMCPIVDVSVDTKPSNAFTDVTIAPWWPCALVVSATRVPATAPTAMPTPTPTPVPPPPSNGVPTQPLASYTLSIPVVFGMYTKDFHPPYSIACRSALGTSVYGESTAYASKTVSVPLKPATLGVYADTTRVSVRLDEDPGLQSSPQTSMAYQCSFLQGPVGGPYTPIAPDAFHYLSVVGTFNPQTTAPIVTQTLGIADL